MHAPSSGLDPRVTDTIDVSSGTLQEMTLYAQYAAAAYCTSNVNSTGTKLTCSTGNCPEVQAANTETLYEFNEYVRLTS